MDPAATSPDVFSSWLRELTAKLPDATQDDWSGVTRGMLRQPERAREIHERYYRLQLDLWAQVLGAPGATAASIAADPGDHRFDDPDWDALPWFRYLKQTYLNNARWLSELVGLAELPPARKRRLTFVLKQAIDAAAPSNFAGFNPEALKLAAQTQGASLQQGLERLQRDVARGRIEMSDESAFAVGRSLAITPGAVVFQNRVAQLIQYQPQREQVHARPLFIVPPFINKYYVLDLRPENSFVRYALEQGHQVFIVSWRNVTPELGPLTWDDYVEQGVLSPLDAVLEITGTDQANALGFCVGGTLLATALAVAGQRKRVSSLTLLATLLDFSDVGDIGVYIDEPFVSAAESAFRDGGVMPGSALASAFASLRSNELVWFFVTNNYLKGRAPRAFDLLYWNGDSANVPGPLYAWYLRNAYLENRLREPGRARVCGAPLDLRDIDLPTFVLATREDHIVPWTSAFESMHLLAGRIEFVLGASGHIAGVVNPPQAQRRHFWVNPAGATDARGWLDGAQQQAGSWWPHWAQWLEPFAGGWITAPASVGSALHRPLEPAPGSYVQESASTVPAAHNNEPH
jgi:polyhydroxyalkanoate synthase